MKSVMMFLKFHALMALAAISKGVSSRRYNRFMRSASKCAPFGEKVKEMLSLSYADVVDGWARLRSNDNLSRHDYIHNMKNGPRISIILRVHCRHDRYIADTISSILSQSYRNWELIVSCVNCVDVADCDALLSKDSRLVFLDGDIRDSWIDEAIRRASGDFLTIVRCGDVIDIDAIFEISRKIVELPSASIIYADEDNVSEAGVRSAPNFKPDWNVDLFYSTNYMSFLTAYRLDTLRQSGDILTENAEAANYDMALRVVERVSDCQIIHIPKVLYSRRNCCNNLNGGEDNDALILCMKALESHLIRVRGGGVTVSPGMIPRSWKVDWPVNVDILVSIIIPTRNCLNLVKIAVESILSKTKYDNYEIIIIDNNSDDEDFLRWSNIIKDDARVRVICDRQKFNYSSINNLATKSARGSVFAFVNNDIEVIDGNWLGEMVSLVQRPEIGCVGAKLLYPDGKIQHGGVIIGLDGVAGHSHVFYEGHDMGYCGRLGMRQQYSAVTAACLLVRKDVFEEVGGFNEVDLAIAFNDVDLCLRIKKIGYSNIWTPYAELIHHESVSRGREDTPEKIKRFMSEIDYMKRTWRTDSYSDSSYNVNLTLSGGSFNYAEPIWFSD